MQLTNIYSLTATVATHSYITECVMLIYFLQSIDVWSIIFMEIIMRWWIIHKYATPPQEYVVVVFFCFAYNEIWMALPCSNFHLLFTSSLKLFKHLKIIKFDDTMSVKLIFFMHQVSIPHSSFGVFVANLAAQHIFICSFRFSRNTNTIVIEYYMWINQHHCFIKYLYWQHDIIYTTACNLKF